jgi:hypothetical protein
MATDYGVQYSAWNQPQQSAFNLGAPLAMNHLNIQHDAYNLAGKIVDIMKEQFSLKPKEQIVMYRRPYPEWFGRVPLPP